VGAPEEAAGTEPDVLEAVKLLVKLGADVNAVDQSGETAMHGAAYRNHPRVVQLLAAKGARIAVWNRKNATGLTPVVIAEGHRPGLNFRPSPETVASLHRVMIAAGVTLPKPTPPPAPKAGYGDKRK
jgi:ankyrin repeat protein